MKLSKVHINTGSEDKPKGLCGTKRAKYVGYARKDIFDDLPFNDKCMFCAYKAGGVEEYYKHDIVGQLKNKI